MKPWMTALLLVAALGCGRKVAGGQANGAKIFAEACARCHGDQGKPGPEMASQLGVRDLSSPELQASFTDAQLRERIVQGSDNRRMPAFEGALTDAQLDAVVAHVRTLGRK